jgi:hypothetical protein
MLRHTVVANLGRPCLLAAGPFVSCPSARGDEMDCNQFDQVRLTCSVGTAEAATAGGGSDEGVQVGISVCASYVICAIPCEISGVHWDVAHQCCASFAHNLTTAPNDNSYVLEFRDEGVVMQCERTVDVGLPQGPFSCRPRFLRRRILRFW